MSILRQVLSSRIKIKEVSALDCHSLLIQDKGTGAISNKPAADRCKKSCTPTPVWSSHR